MTSFAAVDRKLTGAIDDLHNYLWAGKKLDERRLLEDLESGAAALDHHVRARGAIAGGIRPLVRAFRRTTTGADLFAFAEATADLAGAVELTNRKPQEAAKRASRLAASLCIHLASAADRFDLVETFESGRTDFAAFTSSLADVLEERGVLRAGEFRRAVNTAFDMNALWDADAAADRQRIAVLTSVTSAGFACCLLVEALKSLGRYREIPYGKLEPAARRILDRLGGHP